MQTTHLNLPQSQLALKYIGASVIPKLCGSPLGINIVKTRIQHGGASLPESRIRRYTWRDSRNRGTTC